MNKKLVTAASFALGGAGVVLVGYLSANPLAFTHPVEFPFTSASALAPARVTEPRAAVAPSNALVFPDVTITGSMGSMRSSRKSLNKLEPCSEWRDLGPAYAITERAPGIHRVRQLCTASASPPASG